MPTEITATVTAVRFHKATGNGFWMILNCDKMDAKGVMPFVPQPGLRFKFLGDWAAYQGVKEFKFTRALPDVPIDSRQKLRYLCEITKGVGPKAEQMIWDELGEQWTDKEELRRVTKLSNKQFDELQKSMSVLAQHQAQVEAVAFLMTYDATYNMAQAAWEMWREETISKVVGNCYVLANLPNYGFIHVDVKVRHRFNITDTDPRRVQASIYYAIKQLREMGNTAVNWFEVLREAKKITGLHGKLITDECRTMLNAKFLHGWEKSKMLAQMEDYKNEAAIWELLS